MGSGDLLAVDICGCRVKTTPLSGSIQERDKKNKTFFIPCNFPERERSIWGEGFRRPETTCTNQPWRAPLSPTNGAVATAFASFRTTSRLWVDLPRANSTRLVFRGCHRPDSYGHCLGVDGSAFRFHPPPNNTIPLPSGCFPIRC